MTSSALNSSRSFRLPTALVATGLATALVGCGGGGSDPVATTDDTTTTEPCPTGQIGTPGDCKPDPAVAERKALANAKTKLDTAIKAVPAAAAIAAAMATGQEPTAAQLKALDAADTTSIVIAASELQTQIESTPNVPENEKVQYKNLVNSVNMSLKLASTPMPEPEPTPAEMQETAMDTAYKTADSAVESLDLTSDSNAIKVAQEEVNDFRTAYNSANDVDEETKKEYKGFLDEVVKKLKTVEMNIATYRGNTESGEATVTAIDDYNISSSDLNTLDQDGPRTITSATAPLNYTYDSRTKTTNFTLDSTANGVKLKMAKAPDNWTAKSFTTAKYRDTTNQVDYPSGSGKILTSYGAPKHTKTAIGWESLWNGTATENKYFGGSETKMTRDINPGSSGSWNWGRVTITPESAQTNNTNSGVPAKFAMIDILSAKVGVQRDSTAPASDPDYAFVGASFPAIEDKDGDGFPDNMRENLTGGTNYLGKLFGVPGLFQCASSDCEVYVHNGNLRVYGDSLTFTPTYKDNELVHDTGSNTAAAQLTAKPSLAQQNALKETTSSYIISSKGNMLHAMSDLADIIDLNEDQSYITFGYWANDAKTSLDTYATAVYDNTGGGERGLGTFPTDIDGTATYAGPAVGVYALKGTDELEPYSHGEFMATVNLTARFGSTLSNPIDKEDTFSIDGKVSGFTPTMGDDDLGAWELTLGKADTGDGSVVTYDSFKEFEGNTMGGGDDGKWQGTFYGNAGADTPTNTTDDHPMAVVGEFTGHFSNGSAIGVFGAEKKK